MSRKIVFTLAADDWARCRFVRSVLFETTQAVRALMHPRKQVHQRAWVDTIDQAAARARLPLLRALNPAAGWVPDLLAPPPRSNGRNVDDELSEISSYSRESVAAELRRSLDSQPTRARRLLIEPLIAAPDDALARIADELHCAWTIFIAPFWPPIRELIGADIDHRSREIARTGLGRAIGDLHPSVSWHDGAITVDPAFEDTRADLAGRGLALMPSAFIWPDVIAVHGPPWPPTLVYPARGIGDLWSAPARPPGGLTGVLGSTRALLLTDLALPTTTTTLAARHHLSPAAVSAQLALLRDAGLVSARRLGKEVHYRRTRLADALIHAVPRV